MAKINKCAKCGACTTPCPVYKISGKETLAARARVHLLNAANISRSNPRYREIFSKCLLCGACYHSCPRDINTPELIVREREKGAKVGGLANFKKLLVQKSLSSPSLLPRATSALLTLKKAADKLLPGESGLRIKLALFENHQTPTGPGFAQSMSAHNYDGNLPKASFFTGCLANYLQQDIAAASVRCLKEMCGINTIAPSKQICCGMAAFTSGDRKEAFNLAKKNIQAFSAPPYSDLPIFTSCATCFAHLRSYPQLFKEESEWIEKAESFSKRVVEFSSYLFENLRPEFSFETAGKNEISVFNHDPCHLRFPGKHEEKGIKEPRTLMAMVPGLKLVELPDGPQCCGQGGLFNIAHPEDSLRICSSLLTPLFETGAETVVTTCSGCLMQIREGLARNKSKIKAYHLAQLLSSHIKPSHNLVKQHQDLANNP